MVSLWRNGIAHTKQKRKPISRTFVKLSLGCAKAQGGIDGSSLCSRKSERDQGVRKLKCQSKYLMGSPKLASLFVSSPPSCASANGEIGEVLQIGETKGVGRQKKTSQQAFFW